MDTGFRELSYKNILIRQFTETSNDAGFSVSYGKAGHSKEYANDRDAILGESRTFGTNAKPELGVSFHRVSVQIDGVWRPYKIWGDEEKAKAFFAEIERQKSEEEKARIEYEEEVRRELDEEFLRYKG